MYLFRPKTLVIKGTRLFYYTVAVFLTISLINTAFYNEVKKAEIKTQTEITIITHTQKRENVPLFYHLPKFKFLQCSSLYDPVKALDYTKQLKQPRIKYADEFKLSVDCLSIRSRGYFSEKPLSKNEKNFPIAFARIVFKDYYYIESQLRVEWAPQNVFCYVLDASADLIFKKRMRNLATCFDNIIVPNEEILVKNTGINMTTAHLTCLKYLMKRNWKYVILLQNHDVRIKTNAEIVKILQNFYGANDIGASFPERHTVNNSTDWSFASLNLFKNEKLNNVRDEKGQLLSLKPTKSFVQVSISRAAVEFVLNNLNVNKFIEKLEERGYGVDELFWGTLNANDVLQLPGGFTQYCLQKNIRVPVITRYTVWNNNINPLIQCFTKYFRHNSCVFGVEDLINIEKLPHFYINKLLPAFDYSAVECALEKVYNKTYIERKSIESFDDSLYKKLPQVRYRMLKLPFQNIENFNCSIF